MPETSSLSDDTINTLLRLSKLSQSAGEPDTVRWELMGWLVEAPTQS